MIWSLKVYNLKAFIDLIVLLELNSLQKVNKIIQFRRRCSVFKFQELHEIRESFFVDTRHNDFLEASSLYR